MEKLRKIIPLLVVTLTLAISPAWTPSNAQTTTEGQSSVATVESVAGPWCGQDPTDYRVGSLAAGPQGPIYFEVGPRQEGLVAQLDAASRRIKGFYQAGRPASLDPGGVGVGGAGGRLASDGAGGLIYAANDRIIHRGLNIGLKPVAGEESSSATNTSGNGDGGPALMARFNKILSVTSDGAGNVFVADEVDANTSQFVIRAINLGNKSVVFYPGTAGELEVAPGGIATVAGGRGVKNGEKVGGKEEEGGAKEEILLGRPPSLAASAGLLYLGAQWNQGAPTGRRRARSAIRVVNFGGAPVGAHGKTVEPAGIEIIAGGGPSGYGGDGGQASRARLSKISGLSVDALGNLYVADSGNHRVRKVSSTGVLTTIAGTGKAGFNGNDRPSPSALLSSPEQVQAVGNMVYISDSENDQIRVVDAQGQIRAVSGKRLLDHQRCNVGTLGETGLIPPPKPVHPTALAVAGNGDTFFALSEAGSVARLDSRSNLSPAIGDSKACSAAGGCEIYRSQDKSSITARVGIVSDLASGPEGTLYYLEQGPDPIHLANFSPQTVTRHGVRVPPNRVKEVGTSGGPLQPGSKSPESQISRAEAIAVNGKGDVFLSDREGRRVLRLDKAGRLAPISEALRETSTGKCCIDPKDLTVDSRDNLYVLDGRRVWYFNLGKKAVQANGVSIDPGKAKPVAGGGATGLGGDGGPALEAAFEQPSSLVAGERGALYVADSGEATVRRIDLYGIITTVAGTGDPGFNGDGLKGPLTALSSITDLAVDHCGQVLIAEASGRIRRLEDSADCSARVGSEQVPEKAPLNLWLLIPLGLALGIVTISGVSWRRRARLKDPGRSKD